MKIGQVVTNTDRPPIIYGVIIGLDPFGDGEHTQIFWADPDEKDGWIISVWVNTDFRVLGTPCTSKKTINKIQNIFQK